MKKVFSLFLIVAFLGSMVITAGCGGGDSGGIGAIFAGVIVIAIIASSGGAGAAAFAANVQHKTNPAISAAARATVKYKARVKINGVLATETTNLMITDEFNPQTITGNITVSAGTSNPQVTIEILPVNSTTDQPYLKQHFVTTVTDGQTTNATSNVTTAETAKALAYDQWSGAAANSITAFNPAPASISALQTTIENQLITDLPLASPNFVYPAGVTNQAKAVAAATPVTTAPTTTTPTYNVSGNWDFTTNNGNRFVATFVQSGSMITGNGPSWTFSGTVSGNVMTLTTTATSGYSEYWVLTVSSNTAMSGTWETIQGGTGNGTMSATKL